MTDTKTTETPTAGKFKKWEPGPRWFLGVIVQPHQVAICLREVTDESDPTELVGEPHGIYVFGDPVTLGEAHTAVDGMFNGTGPSIVDIFRTRLEAVLIPVPLPIVPAEA